MFHLRIIFTVFLVSVTTATDVTQQPARSPLCEGEEPAGLWRPLADYTECDGVSAGQVTCADSCHTILLCMGDTLPPTVLDQCKDPSVCSAEDRKCVNGTSACTRANQNITCHGTGLFPDPYDCTVYHICMKVDENSTRRECDSGWAYDSVTASCSIKPTDSVCTELPITCSNLTETNIFPGNPNIYYICILDKNQDLIPAMYKCDHGGTYDPGTLSCIDPTTASPSPTASPSSETPTSPSDPASPSSETSTSSRDPSSPSSETPTPPNTPPVPTTTTVKPPSPGSPCSTYQEIIADPDSCYSYYECSVMYMWEYVRCNTGYYFNKEELTCKYGACPYS